MNLPPDAASAALLDQLWRNLDQRIRDLFLQEFKAQFGQTFAGGKLSGGSIGGTIPPSTVAGGSAGQVLTTEPGVPYLGAPSAPTLTTAAAGGTIAAAVYGAEVSYVNAQGETIGSAPASITTSGSTSTLTITAPPASGTGSQAATGWYAYVTQPGGSTYTRQQTAGSPTAIGTNLVLTAPPTNTGTAPPGSNTAATLIGSWGSAGAGTVIDVTGTAPVAVASGTTTPVISVPPFVASGASHAAGLVPDPGATAGITRYLREDATFAVPAGKPVLGYSQVQLATDVALTAGSTYYSVLSLTLAAGTWLLIASIQVVSTTTANFTAAIAVGTAAALVTASASENPTYGASIPIVWIVTPSGSTTYTISVASNTTGGTVTAQTMNNPSGNTATSFVAVQIG